MYKLFMSVYSFKNFIYVIIFFLQLVIQHAIGQITFSKVFDIDGQIDQAIAVRAQSDGYLILGSSYCFDGSVECYTYFKTDLSGNLVWKKLLSNFPRSITPQDGYGNHGIATKLDFDDLFFIGTKYNLNTGSDYFLMRTNGNGDSLWLKQYGGPRLDLSSDIFFSSDTTLIIFGKRFVGQNDDRVSLMQVDLNGNVIWEKVYGKINTKVAREDIIHLKNGDMVFTKLYCEVGTNCLIGDPKQLMMTRVDANGNEIWTKQIYTYLEYFSDCLLLELDTGDILVSFYENNFGGTGPFYYPVFLWVDSTGEVKKEITLPSDTEIKIHDMILSSSGNIVATGYIDKLEKGYAGLILSLTQDGEMLWEREIQDGRDKLNLMDLYALAEADDGGLILTGTIYITSPDSQSFSQDIWLVKLDSNGCYNPDCENFQIITATHDLEDTWDNFKIFPSPTSDALYIESPASQSTTMNITLWDVDGRPVAHKTCETYASLDVSNLPTGIYIIKILSPEGKLLYTKSVMISR